MKLLLLSGFLSLLLAPLALADEWQPRSVYDWTSDPTRSEVLRIQDHLGFVVDLLRERDVSHLDAETRRNRARCIERLEEYRSDGTFPRNIGRDHPTPVFIDEGGRACAVADLMIASGACELARTVADAQNTAYVPDITIPGVGEWMSEHGLSLEECAMIQPTYCNAQPSNFECSSVGAGVFLSWVNEQNYDEIIIIRVSDVEPTGFLVAWVPGDATEYLDPDPPWAQHTYIISGNCGGPFPGPGQSECLIDHAPLPYIRGDADADGTMNALADTVFLLEYGFLGGPVPPCFDAADSDDDGVINALTDAILILEHGFYDGPPPAAPYPACGLDPTDDDLDCVAMAACT